MNDLEPTLGPGYTQSSLYYDKPITYTNAFKYVLDVLNAFNKAQEIPEFTDEEIARYYE